MKYRPITWGTRLTVLLASVHLAALALVRGAAPVSISTPVTTTAVGESYEYFTVATDPAGGPVSYLPVTVPSWLSLADVSDPRLYSVAGTLDRGSGKPGIQVQLWGPSGGAYDLQGNLYVADRSNHRVWKLTPAGTMTTVAGTGEPGFDGDGGAATRARLFDPTAVAVNSAGDLFIADRLNHRIRRVSSAGIILTVAGTGAAGSLGDGGSALAAQLSQPAGVVVDGQGALYITDTGNHRLRVVSVSGIINAFAGSGNPDYNGENLPALEAGISAPVGLALEPGGSVVFADAGQFRVRRVTTAGRVQTIAGNGLPGFDGENVPATSARLYSPQGVAVDAEGILIADTLSSRIRRVGLDGRIRTVAGEGHLGFSGDGGPATAAQLFLPSGVASVPGGGFAVLDTSNDRVRMVNTAGVIGTVAGAGVFASTGDGGPATAATLLRPMGAAAGPGGVVFVADTSSHIVRRINADQTIVTVAGTGSPGFSGDNGPGTLAALSSPRGIAVDGAGNVFIADSANNRIRKLSAAGTMSTFAGTGQVGDDGDNGDNGPALSAKLSNPRALTFDPQGNLYVVDQGHSRVRRIGTDGIIRAAAGSGGSGFAGDGGQATLAKFSQPGGVATDASGNLYICDTGNQRVRKVSSQGIITTLAGNGSTGFSGDGGPATNAALNAPSGVVVGGDGGVYIADYSNHRIRLVNSSGVIVTFAGSGAVGPGGGGHSGDGGPPAAATLLNPVDVEILPGGQILIVEQALGFVREVFPTGTVLQGTVPAGTEESHTVTVQAKAGEATTDQSFTLQVETLPTIAAQPQPQQVQAGETASFSVTAAGSAPLSYQWLRNGAVLTDFDRISGSSTAQLTVANAQSADAGQYQVVVLNAAGATASQAARLTVIVDVPVAPGILQQPRSQVARVGSSVQFAVWATGTEPLFYQWWHAGVPLTEGSRFTGTRSAQLTLSSVEVGDAGDYLVVIQNVAGSATGGPATLTVDTSTPPVITQEPQSQTVLAGASVSFQVAATGTEPLSYQWWHAGVPLADDNRLSGTRTAQLTVSNVEAGDGGDYLAVVQNTAGSATSRAATLTVELGVAPAITGQPQSQSVLVGTASVSFQVVATGTEPLTYEWSHDGIPLAEGGRFVGTRTAMLTVSNVEAGDAGEYGVVVRNVAGAATSSPAVLTVESRTPPVITQQPESQSVSAGASVSFQVVATGTPPLSYQWWRGGSRLTDGARVTGSRTAQLTLTSVEAADAGDYAVVIQNGTGSATSTSATLTVGSRTPPVITQQPESRTAPAGDSVTFQVIATGTEPLSYQWWRGGSRLVESDRFVGTRTAQLTLPSVEAGDAGDYVVVIQNVAGSATSAPATLTVETEAPLTLSQTRLKGAAISFFVSGPAGELCEIQSSTDLVEWSKLTELPLEASPVEVTDPATGEKRFYRAVIR